jgi:hypothetical protein
LAIIGIEVSVVLWRKMSAKPVASPAIKVHDLEDSPEYPCECPDCTAKPQPEDQPKE